MSENTLPHETVNKIAVVLAKEMGLITGFNRDRMALLQSRIHEILNRELLAFIRVAEKKTVEEAQPVDVAG